jgi:hypothetical protein
MNRRAAVLAAGVTASLVAPFAPGVAEAATSSFTVSTPWIGSTTAPQNYVTTSEFRDINVRLTSSVLDGTCFKVNFDAPTLSAFTVSGRVSY